MSTQNNIIVQYFLYLIATTGNREILVHENIHVLNVFANKFSWVPTRRYLTPNCCEVEIRIAN